jgi:hypothetical protein
VEAQTGCESGSVCESVEGSKPACFAPVEVSGRVVDSGNGEALAGARVVARDASGALVSREVATSASDGSFKLTVPVVRKADGSPVAPVFTLRADARGYATFPSGLRVALPVDVTQPRKVDNGRYVIENPTTSVSLDALDPAEARRFGTVKGTVKADGAAGALVVAGPGPNAPSGIAAPDGSYVVFNVPEGARDVRGYIEGVQLTNASANVRAGEETTGIDLAADAAALSTVRGAVQFVNAGASSTAVVLVVKDTFNANLTRGEVPKGLRAANVTGAFEFKNVPNGQYVVLAAFDNDQLVRDPDTTIGGTTTQEITVSSGTVSVPGFKITGALDVVAPGAAAPEPVSGTPTFAWKDDSSEDGYELRVFDTFGKLVWENTAVPRATGSAHATATYAGPALAPGYYQFRALSYRNKGGGPGGRTYISATEDLKGVFIVR